MTALLDEYLSLMKASDARAATVNAVSADTITDKDTLIVVDMQHDFLPGGAFGVAEGDKTISGICGAINLFASKGATVIATRDYHPVNHCSFATHGGPFPPHCIQGTRGSFLHDDIAKTLQPLLSRGENNKNVHVVFKAFSPDVDSFGAFQYPDDRKERVSSRQGSNCHCSLDWTGGYSLFSSNLANDANAPPDVMSVLNRKALADLVPKGGRMFVCGLALDFCVLDTAINYRKSVLASAADASTEPVFILAPLARAAHIPGVGKFGTGFLTDPAEFARNLGTNGIALASI